MRRKRIKRWGRRSFILLAGVGLIGSFAACSSNEDKVEIVKDMEKDPEYLSFFSLDSLAGSDIGKYWSEQFAQKYNQEIYVSYDGATYYSEEGMSYRELLEKRLQGGFPDDLYIINAEDVIEFEKKGYWLDLSGMTFVENLSEAALYQSSYNGKIFSVPLEFTGFGFYWNVDMLKKYSLSVPENIEDFLNVCSKLKAEGILPYGANKGYALTVPAMCKGMAGLYEETGKEQRIAELNSGTVPISTYMHEGYEFLLQMIEKGYLDPQQALETIPGDELEMFLNEECAFICAGLGNEVLQGADNVDFGLTMTGLPVLEDRCIAVYGADTRLCVNPASKHLDTALEFVEMVGTTEALNKSASISRTMSAAKNSDVMELSVQQSMCELLRQPGQIPNQDFALHFNTWENIRDIAREICKGCSIEEACGKLDAKQQEELEQYSEEGGR